MAQVQTGNLPIENDTGINFRADVNENITALQTNNAGSSVPPVAKANQWYVDTNTNPPTLKIRGNADNAALITVGPIEANLGMLPKSGGTLTDVLKIPSGSAAAPKLSFDGDEDTGIYRPSSGTLAITSNNAAALLVSSAVTRVQGTGSNPGKIALEAGATSNAVSLSAPALTGNVDLIAPADTGSSGQYLKSQGNGQPMLWASVAGVPSGAIFCVAFTDVGTKASGYLVCDGEIYTNAQHPTLFTAIGQTYGGSGSGSTATFRVPDLRGIFVRGLNTTNSGHDTNRTFNNTVQGSQMQQHTHTASANSSVDENGGHRHDPTDTDPATSSVAFGHSIWVNDNNGGNYGSGSGWGGGPLGNRQFMKNAETGISVSTSVSVNATGGTDNGSENRPYNMAMIYIIKI